MIFVLIGRMQPEKRGPLSNNAVGPRNIVLIDPDEAFCQVLQPLLNRDYLLLQDTTISFALAAFDSKSPDAVLLNLDAFETEQNIAVLRTATDRAVPLTVIGYSWGNGNKVQDAFREGAFDTLSQPLDVQQLRFALDRACRRSTLARELSETRRLLGVSRIAGLLGNSKAMERVTEVTQKVAEVFTNVLITGESGTGKGLIAQAIHRLSPRTDRPFVSFAACNFPESLIEDELFGHEKGAFTGAGQARRGRFEEANGGTIFIDEIGDLALPLQAKLLRALQERVIERLGSNVPRPVDVRVICATNRNLEKMVEEGSFREDLYFRISVVKIQMPALRQRREDIPLLAEHFLRTFAKMHKKAARTLTPGFMSALTRHPWPGNVRELQNVIERSVVLANGHEHLGVNDLPEEMKELTIPSDDEKVGSFHDAVQAFKKELVRSALRAHSGNKLKAALELGISRCYLHRLLNQFNLGDENSAEQESDDEDQSGLRQLRESPCEPSRIGVRIA
jgi:two-component system, NtrC family, response regulator HydG